MVAKEFLTDPQTFEAPSINDIQNKQLSIFLEDIKFLLEHLRIGKEIKIFEEGFNSQLFFIYFLLQLYKEVRNREDLTEICTLLIQYLDNPSEGLQFTYKSLISLIKEIEKEASAVVTQKREKTRLYTILAMQSALLSVMVDICKLAMINKNMEPPGIKKTLQICMSKLADWYNAELLLFSKSQAMKGRYLYKPSTITTRKLTIFRY